MGAILFYLSTGSTLFAGKVGCGDNIIGSLSDLYLWETQKASKIGIVADMDFENKAEKNKLCDLLSMLLHKDPKKRLDASKAIHQAADRSAPVRCLHKLPCEE